MSTIPPNVWPIPLVDDALFIDNSTQEKIMTCKRAGGYYVCHKREGNKPKTALEFGKIMHKALEVRYRDGSHYLDATLAAKMIEAVNIGFANWSPDADDFRNYGMAVAAIKKYTDTYPLEDFDVFAFPNGAKFVELPFAQPLGTIAINAKLWVRNPDQSIVERHVDTITVVQKGKIDLVVQREGRIYGLDHKTTSIMGPQYFSEFELASQIHCYSWAIQKLTGTLPSGYIINALGIRKPTKTGNSLEFIRSTIPIHPSLVAEWELDAMHIVSDFIEMARAGYLPKETKWCVGKYGACEFKPVCGLEPEFRSMSLYSNEYRPVTWDPLKE
jgi:hypothetical protein